MNKKKLIVKTCRDRKTDRQTNGQRERERKNNMITIMKKKKKK